TRSWLARFGFLRPQSCRRGVTQHEETEQNCAPDRRSTGTLRVFWKHESMDHPQTMNETVSSGQGFPINHINLAKEQPQ
ncbi:MAG: hypothetical protein ACKOU6_10855, partial [Planctomycetota bacterium]